MGGPHTPNAASVTQQILELDGKYAVQRQMRGVPSMSLLNFADV